MTFWNRFISNFSRRARRRVQPLPRRAIRNADAIVTCNEVSDQHGTGVLLSRIFGECPNILSIRSTQLYDQHTLGHQRLVFGHHRLARRESFERVLFALNGSTVRRVVCVPFLADELITAIVLKELFEAPLCTYLMDDNNLYGHGISDELMREVLSKSELRLAISPEMRDAYEQRYGLKFWVVPPIVRPEAVRTEVLPPGQEALQSRVGVLIGTLWSKAWLQKFRQTVKAAGLTVHWYGNAKAKWLEADERELERDGIIDCGFLPETELTEKLKQYAYALVPSGTLDQEDDRQEISRLSLPTRLPYLLAAAQMPVVVLGSRETGAARFVERFQTGVVTPYDPAKVRAAVDGLCRPERQLEFRRRAAAQASLFSASGLAEWIWKSLELGDCCDDRFEQAFRRNSQEIVNYLDPPAPKDLTGDFVLVYQALRRLKRRGLSPDFILDVGASSGVWSDVAHRVFPRSRFVLVDPLHSHYLKMNDWFFRKHPDFECVPVAVSDRPGEAELNISPDLYGSSLFRPADLRPYEALKVPVRTLDELALEKKLTGRGILKIDVQFAEHLVLAGARKLLPQIDALLLELSLVKYASQCILFPEMCELTRSLGFRYYEDIGGWRSPVDGTPLQKDVLFLREGLFLQDQPASALTTANGEPAVRDGAQTRGAKVTTEIVG